MREAVRTAIASLATLSLILALWSAAIGWFDLPPQVLPGPLEVISTWWHGWSSGAFWPHARFTLQGALGGWLIGACLGVLAGVVVGEWRLVRRIVYPIVIAIQSMPTVAVAPLIVVYFGVDLPSKLVTVALLCFFPVFVNTVAGLGTADPRLLDLYRAASATRWRTLTDVRLPAAADQILAGLQVALVLSFIGCVVSEFVASRAGLGYLVKTFATDLNVAVMFAAVLSLAIIGSALGFGLGKLRTRVVFWREER